MKKVFKLVKFPSPYGVSFILMIGVGTMIYLSIIIVFPSPYGVSFILIRLFNSRMLLFYNLKKSFRLLTEYHSFLL